jgi:aminoglycoside phosphotransferase (APT) family kinase protein
MAEVFAWREGWALKLYHPGVTEAAARHEYDLTRRAHTLGLASPAVAEFTQINNRFGFVMERLDGPTMMTLMQAQPWRLVEFAHMLAGLHAQMHRCQAAGWPSQREQFAAIIRRAGADYPEAREAVLQALSLLPDGDRLCHGDFHPDNVLMTARGPVIVDWNNSVCGHPLADVARTVLMAKVGELPPGPVTRRLLQWGRGWFLSEYQRRYFHLCPQHPAGQLAAWEAPVVAVRLAEGIPSETRQLLSMLKRALPAVRINLT